MHTCIHEIVPHFRYRYEALRQNRVAAIFLSCSGQNKLAVMLLLSGGGFRWTSGSSNSSKIIAVLGLYKVSPRFVIASEVEAGHYSSMLL